MKNKLIVLFGVLLFILAGLMIYLNRDVIVRSNENTPLPTSAPAAAKVPTSKVVVNKDEQNADAIFNEQESTDNFDDIVD